MDARTAENDLAFLRSVLDRTRRRVDPHAFHFVAWGAIVLVWYPAQNALELRGAPAAWQIGLGTASLLLGATIGAVGEMRLARRTDLPPEDEPFSRQVILAVWGALLPAVLLSFLGPALQLFEGQRVPLVWGLAYAAMAWTIGVVYSREFLFGAAWIFMGCLAALAAPEWAGFALGPTMGLGLLVPGLVAMRRVRADRRTRARAPEAPAA